MASLKEIKGRISSVQSTLKITSAMKMISAAKLRKAQKAISGMLAYQSGLNDILRTLKPSFSLLPCQTSGTMRAVIVCVSSNSSLCGAFNANAAHRAAAVADELQSQGWNVEIIAVGRKAAEILLRAGYAVSRIDSDLSASASYGPAAALAADLTEDFKKGGCQKVLLVYNHYKSAADQPTVCETFLPVLPLSSGPSGGSLTPEEDAADVRAAFILEPERAELIQELLPKVLKLKLFSVLLDAAAAEHAARTVAMQMASDNGGKLLGELTLIYNKSRQQKITSEILDLEGGRQED